MFKIAINTGKRSRLLNWLILAELLLVLPLPFCKPIIPGMVQIPSKLAALINANTLCYLSIAATPIPFLSCALHLRIIRTKIDDFPHASKRSQTLIRMYFSSGVPAYLICQLCSLLTLTALLLIDPQKLALSFTLTSILSAILATKRKVHMVIKAFALVVTSICSFVGIFHACHDCLVTSRSKEADEATQRP